MPLGNGALTASAWANVSAGGISVYLGHQAAQSSHQELFKLAFLTISLSPSPFATGEFFEQALDLATGTVSIMAGGTSAATAAASLRVYVDANYDQLLIDITSPAGTAFSLNATLYSARPASPWTYPMSFPLCSPVHCQPDVFVDPLPSPVPLRRPSRPLSPADAVRHATAHRAPTRTLPDPLPPMTAFLPASLVVFHRNVPEDWTASGMSSLNMTLTQQGIPQLLASTPDHWVDLQFGLALDGGGNSGGNLLRRASPYTLVSTTPATTFSLRASALVLQADTVEEWLTELGAAVAGAPPSPRSAHESWWGSFWNRSYIRVAVSEQGQPNASLSSAISEKYAYTRYLHAIQSRGTIWPIKFNGGAFMAHATGSDGGADYRIWGPSNWWQNTRLPYGSMLAAGDFEEMRVILEYFSNAALLLVPRTRAYWGHDGMWTTEAHHLSGAYQMFDYGCSRPTDYPVQYETSGYLHVDQGGNSGQGEWSLMALDYFAATGDSRYLPLAFHAADYFMYHFLGNVSASGRVVIWPAQVLETYWCYFNTTTARWDNCCEDDAPTISGMLTLFEKLLALPPGLTTPQQRASWAEFSSLRMPLLPLKPDGTIAPARVLSTGPIKNSEGPELFAMHPHRVFTKGREVATGRNISTGIATYLSSAWAKYSNVGWNYAINAAVLLGLTEAAVPQLISRALTTPAPGYRFPGFAPQFQDYDPSADHFANFARALQEMLLQGGEDGFGNATIVLFPSWPCEWDVDAKLWAPGNTTVSHLTNRYRPLPSPPFRLTFRPY